ncbi:TPA: hypothetical protein EYP38_01970 [Candidatus Micrarchaeota archaeon]|nr:hypothetical protein [Candidatus Micrarchaeota archaeon]
MEWGSTPHYEIGHAFVSEYGSGNDGHQFRFEMGRLPADTLIYYRVTVDGKEYDGTYRSAPENGAGTLTFYAYSDTQANPMIHDEVLKQLLIDMKNDPGARQTIALHGGDYVSSGLDEAVWDDEFFRKDYTHIQEFLSLMPLMGAAGNHEIFEGGAYVPEVPEGKVLYRKYWPNPLLAHDGSFYYSFDYGPLHVTVLDQYTANYSEGSAQYLWMKEDLEGTDRPWKVVMFHAPGWSAYGIQEPGTYPHENNEAVQADLHPLFVENGVRIVLQGHNHYYARNLVDGISYLTLGGGGGHLYVPDPGQPHVVAVAEEHHFARIEIDGNETLISIIDKDGDLIDWFTTTIGDE